MCRGVCVGCEREKVDSSMSRVSCYSDHSPLPPSILPYSLLPPLYTPLLRPFSLSPSAVDRLNSKQVQTVFCEGARLVKTHQFYFTTQIDPGEEGGGREEGEEGGGRGGKRKRREGGGRGGKRKRREGGGRGGREEGGRRERGEGEEVRGRGGKEEGERGGGECKRKE